MRLIQNSMAIQRGNTASVLGTSGQQEGPFDPTLFIRLLIFLRVLFLHYNLILFKICKFLCSACFGSLFFAVFCFAFFAFCNSFLVSSFGLFSVAFPCIAFFSVLGFVLFAHFWKQLTQKLYLQYLCYDQLSTCKETMLTFSAGWFSLSWKRSGVGRLAGIMKPMEVSTRPIASIANIINARCQSFIS